MNAPALRDIPGFAGRYAVTFDGRVWAHPKVWRTGKGRGVVHSHNGRWLTQIPNNAGYPYVELALGDRGRKFAVHRLVALAWIPNPQNLPEVNHRDGVKTNSVGSNLEWCTASENARHAHATGLVKIDDAYRATHRLNGLASNIARRRLTMEQVADIRHRYAAGETQVALAAAYRVGQQKISLIVNGKAYVA